MSLLFSIYIIANYLSLSFVWTSENNFTDVQNTIAKKLHLVTTNQKIINPDYQEISSSSCRCKFLCFTNTSCESVSIGFNSTMLDTFVCEFSSESSPDLESMESVITFHSQQPNTEQLSPTVVYSAETQSKESEKATTGEASGFNAIIVAVPSGKETLKNELDSTSQETTLKESTTTSETTITTTAAATTETVTSTTGTTPKYFVTKGDTSWDEKNFHDLCQKEGGVPAIIPTEDEIIYSLQNWKTVHGYENEFWVAAKIREGGVYWTDDTKVDYKPLQEQANYPPNQGCIISKRNSVGYATCSMKMGVLCERQ